MENQWDSSTIKCKLFLIDMKIRNTKYMLYTHVIGIYNYYYYYMIRKYIYTSRQLSWHASAHKKESRSEALVVR